MGPHLRTRNMYAPRYEIEGPSIYAQAVYAYYLNSEATKAGVARSDDDSAFLNESVAASRGSHAAQVSNSVETLDVLHCFTETSFLYYARRSYIFFAEGGVTVEPFVMR